MLFRFENWPTSGTISGVFMYKKYSLIRKFDLYQVDPESTSIVHSKNCTSGEHPVPHMELLVRLYGNVHFIFVLFIC